MAQMTQMNTIKWKTKSEKWKVVNVVKSSQQVVNVVNVGANLCVRPYFLCRVGRLSERKWRKWREWTRIWLLIVSCQWLCVYHGFPPSKGWHPPSLRSSPLRRGERGDVHIHAIEGRTHRFAPTRQTTQHLNNQTPQRPQGNIRAESPIYFSPIPSGWGIDAHSLFEGLKAWLNRQPSACVIRNL